VTTANVEVGGELTVSNILAKTTLLAHSQQKVVSNDRGSQDNFGKSVSISGDGNFAVVGAHQEDEDVSGSSTLSNAGAAYIYKYNGSTWSQVQKIVASDRAVNTQFGWSVSISNDGNSIVIGAVAESMDASGSNQISAAGAAYIFTYNGSAWVQIQKVVASDRATYDLFGKSVSISGDGNTFAVGADAEDEDESGANTLSGSGSVYIFTRDTANVLTSTWSQQKKLVATDRSAGAYFGSSLSVSSDGQTILVGAYGESEDVSGANTLTLAGAAYIFTYSGSTWTQKQKIVASNRIGDGYFGWGVSISKDGNVALIGEAGITGTGAAYTFTRDTLNDLTSSWTFQQKLVSNDITSGDAFGKNVSLSNDGNVAIISANGNGTDESGGNNISNAGAAYIFSRNGTTWSQIKKIVASDRTSSDNLSSSSGEGTGVSISSNGNKAIVGAALQDTDENSANNLTNAGAAYIFLNLASSQSNLNIDGNAVATGNVTAGSFLGDGSELTALNAANIGSGTLPVARGGTGTTSSTGTGALVLQNAPSFTGDVNVEGNLKIQGHNTKRVLIGYQRFTNATGSSWSDSTSGWQNAWSVNYVRKKAGSQIYVIADVCLAQAMGANGTASYRGIDVRLKVYDQVSDRFSDYTRDWQRIDNSSHEYQRQSRVHFPSHTLPGAQAGWTVTVVAQVSRTTGSGTRGSWGINIWSGRSFIEVFETMEA
jgi:autotransporter-associated beta strand protein